MRFLLTTAVLLMAHPPAIPMTAIRGRVAMECKAPAEKAKAVTQLSEVDWCNHAFPLFQLRQGRSELREYLLEGSHDTTDFALEGVVYNAAGNEAAVVVSVKNATPTQRETLYSSHASIFIYAWKGGKAVLRGTLHEVDPVNEIGFDQQTVIVKAGLGPTLATRSYQWKDGAFKSLE